MLNGGEPMSIDANKALVQRFIEDVYNQGNVEAIESFLVPGSLFAGGLAGQIKVIRTAFPDFQVSIDEMIAEGDKVAVRTTTRGTNSGPLAGLPAFGKFDRPLPPTGHSILGDNMYVFTIREGRIVSLASSIDQLSLVQQLGWTIGPPAADA